MSPPIERGHNVKCPQYLKICPPPPRKKEKRNVTTIFDMNNCDVSLYLLEIYINIIEMIESEFIADEEKKPRSGIWDLVSLEYTKSLGCGPQPRTYTEVLCTPSGKWKRSCEHIIFPSPS